MLKFWKVIKSNFYLSEINRGDVKDTEIEATMDSIVDSLFSVFVTLGKSRHDDDDNLIRVKKPNVSDRNVTFQNLVKRQNVHLVSLQVQSQ